MSNKHYKIFLSNKNQDMGKKTDNIKELEKKNNEILEVRG
jgi:hypothetical protein